MSEPKRVSFTTISSVVTSSSFNTGGGAGASGVGIGGNMASASSLRFGSDFLSGNTTDKVDKPKNNKTLRLNLELFPSDTCTYPEFNYSKLIYFEKKTQKKLKQKSNGLSDPFEDNDDDVARIAKELEKKYGTAYARGSKKDDHCDIGLGYDESDSFIDNTEAYDEIIPEEIETIEGGFYINCGPLEFKKLHGESTTTKTDEIIKMPNRPKKRILSSSSEDTSSTDKDGEANCDDDDDEDEDDDEVETETENETEEKSTNELGREKPYKQQPAQKRTKLDSSSSGVAANNNNANSNSNGNSTEQLKKSHTDGGNSTKKKDKHITGLSSSSTSNSPKVNEEIQGSDSEKERIREQKTVKTTTVKDMLKAKRDNFLKMQVNAATTSTKTDDDDDDEGSTDDDNETGSDSNTGNNAAHTDNLNEKPATNTIVENTEKTQLPYELNSEHSTLILQFTEFVQTKCANGKKFQFDEKAMQLFMKLDETLSTDKNLRTKVFSHLEFCLQLPKYFFLRKVKQFRIKEEKTKTQRALGKLRKAIIEIMPSAIDKYEIELRKYAELQEDKLNDDKPPKMPKKKFPWNNNLRQMLYDLYLTRKDSFEILGTRKVTDAEFVNSYIQTKVVELWPNGWMRYEDLMKEIEQYQLEQLKKSSADRNARHLYEDVVDVHSDSDSIASSTTSGAGPNANINSNANILINQQQNEIKAQKANSKKQNKTRTDKKQKNEMSPANIIICGASSSTTIKTNNYIPVPSPIAVVDLISPPRRTDQNIYLPQPTNSNILQQQQQQQQQLIQQKHSKSSENGSNNGGRNMSIVPIIDLDKLSSPSDILETTKLMNAMAASQVLQQQQQHQHSLHRVSSESDSVEFISIFPTKTPASSSSALVTGTSTSKQSINITTNSSTTGNYSKHKHKRSDSVSSGKHRSSTSNNTGNTPIDATTSSNMHLYGATTSNINNNSKNMPAHMNPVDYETIKDMKQFQSKAISNVLHSQNSNAKESKQ